MRRGRLCEGGRQSSMWWKIICKVREGVGEGVGNWFEENIRRVVGDGRDTFFWYDTWVGDVQLRLKILACLIWRWIRRVRWLTWGGGGGRLMEGRGSGDAACLRGKRSV